MGDHLDRDILKGVSRSFYLSLRLLPSAMRGAASLAYLIARTSDTIADTEGVPVEIRKQLLADYAGGIANAGPSVDWPEDLLSQVDPAEKELLSRDPDVLRWLAGTDPGQTELIREVVATIISGQLLDLERFGVSSPGRISVMPDAAALDDYTWRVAGCVGAFWTKLGLLTMGNGYSGREGAALIRCGIEYGKGLQLVNILRDLPRDLANGRCYLPVENPSDTGELMACFGEWHGRACEGIEQGISYASSLRSRRLRAATVLPALIAEETLALLKGTSWDRLSERIKVPRHRVYRLLVEAALFPGES